MNMFEEAVKRWEREQQQKKDIEADFAVRQFKYFIHCKGNADNPVILTTYFDSSGKFEHFNCEFSDISDGGDFSNKPFLIALRDFLISLDLNY